MCRSALLVVVGLWITARYLCGVAERAVRLDCLAAEDGGFPAHRETPSGCGSTTRRTWVVGTAPFVTAQMGLSVDEFTSFTERGPFVESRSRE